MTDYRHMISINMGNWIINYVVLLFQHSLVLKLIVPNIYAFHRKLDQEPGIRNLALEFDKQHPVSGIQQMLYSAHPLSPLRSQQKRQL
jgi:type IV secretory pathway VirB3-like protein